MNINNICNYYSDRNFEALARDLNHTDRRIGFERWLLKNFSPQEALDTEYAWHSRVLALLCSKSGADGNESAEERTDEVYWTILARTHLSAAPPVV